MTPLDRKLLHMADFNWPIAARVKESGLPAEDVLVRTRALRSALNRERVTPAKRHSPEQKALVRRLLQDPDRTLGEIAAQTGVSDSVACEIAKQCGLSRRRRKNTPALSPGVTDRRLNKGAQPEREPGAFQGAFSARHARQTAVSATENPDNGAAAE
jgi:hypothetical protein